MKKYREDLELIRLSKEGDTEAQLELWRKWEPFTGKRFFQSRELFLRTGVTYEDYMQNAYIAFLTAIDRFDLSRTEVSNFSTVYYFQLMKLKNASEGYEYKYGEVAFESDIHCQNTYENPHKEDSVNDGWNRALARDITTDFRQAQALEVIETFYEEEESPLVKNVLTLMLQGKRTKAITELLGEEFDTKTVGKIVWNIKKRLRSIGERVMFEPISVRG